MKLLASVTFLCAMNLVVSASNIAYAQTLPYIAVGQAAQFDPSNGEYSGSGFGFPFGFQSIEGVVIPDPIEPEEGVFFAGTFEGTQVTHTPLGDIHSTLSGDVLLEFDENGMAFGQWNPSFVITGGTGLFRRASGRFEGVAINPPFDPAASATWPFDWFIAGRINLGFWR